MIPTFLRALFAKTSGRPFAVERRTSPYADPYALQTTHVNSRRVF